MGIPSLVIDVLDHTVSEMFEWMMVNMCDLRCNMPGSDRSVMCAGFDSYIDAV